MGPFLFCHFSPRAPCAAIALSSLTLEIFSLTHEQHQKGDFGLRRVHTTPVQDAVSTPYLECPGLLRSDGFSTRAAEPH